MVFDSRADGFVRGEACAAGVLKATESNGLCMVVSSAVRQDGKSASLTAPNGSAQQRLLKAVSTVVERESGILVESASTGSPLGDPIEAGAIVSSVLEASTVAAVGSIKANIGHTESASGSAGLMKLLVSLRRAQAAPNAQLRRLGQHVRAAVHQARAQ